MAHGQPEAGTAPAAGCPAHGYAITTLQANPNAPATITGTGAGWTGTSGMDIRLSPATYILTGDM